QIALNAAAQDPAIGDGSNTFTVGVSTTGALTITSTDPGLKLHGNTFTFSFVGPDFSNAFDIFNQFSGGFSFSQVIQGLPLIVHFLNRLHSHPHLGGIRHAPQTQLPPPTTNTT